MSNSEDKELFHLSRESLKLHGYDLIKSKSQKGKYYLRSIVSGRTIMSCTPFEKQIIPYVSELIKQLFTDLKHISNMKNGIIKEAVDRKYKELSKIECNSLFK